MYLNVLDIYRFKQSPLLELGKLSRVGQLEVTNNVTPLQIFDKYSSKHIVGSYYYLSNGFAFEGHNEIRFM